LQLGPQISIHLSIFFKFNHPLEFFIKSYQNSQTNPVFFLKKEKKL
jgi:hypothetical protein